MTAVLVTVILNLVDGAENPYVKGTAHWTPSQEFPDVEDQQQVGMARVSASFAAGRQAQVTVIANDTAGPQQEDGTPGWTWDVTYSRDTPGSPAADSYYVLSTNGDTQYLSSLASVPAAQPGQMYVPLPQNTPGVGNVPSVASVSPLVMQWQANSGADKNYVQAFSVASLVSVAHNLGKYPAVTVFDSAGDQVEGDVDYTDLDNLTVTFSAPFSGEVTCN